MRNFKKEPNLKLNFLDLKMLTSMLNFELWGKQQFAKQEQISKLEDSRNYKGKVLKSQRGNITGKQRHDRMRQYKEKKENEGEAIF